MGNEFLWAQARRIDNTLQGEDWPKTMTPAQISRQHFHTNDDRRKTLLNLLNKMADFGGLEFDDVVENYAWNYGSATVGYAVYSDYFDEKIREMYRKARENGLSKLHQPVCGWSFLLTGVKPGETIRLGVCRTFHPQSG